MSKRGRQHASLRPKACPNKVCVESLLQLSLQVYDKAFSKGDIESRVGLTDLHVAKVLDTFQKMLKQRYLAGKQGLSDIQLGGHGTEFTHESAVFEVEEQCLASSSCVTVSCVYSAPLPLWWHRTLSGPRSGKLEKDPLKIRNFISIQLISCHCCNLYFGFIFSEV